MSQVSSRLDNLDLLRGLAALAVLGGHLRAYIFQSYSDLEQAGVQIGVVVKAFYFATGLGHQAVMIFFALSGFLVGGKALSDILRRRFSWSRYLLRRLTRLWIVIVPTLVLTLLFDKIGIALTHGVGYDGRYSALYASGVSASSPIDHSLLTFLGNLAFLQTIYFPIFGSNYPMWSLANEFWYYIVFPLAAWLGFAGPPMVGKAVGFAILVLLVVMLPMGLLEGGAIWAAGAGAAWCARQPALFGFLRAFPVRISALTLLVATLIVSKSPNIALGDLGLGIAAALTLPVVAHLPSLGGMSKFVARASSELSSTLSMTRFPLLSLIVLAGIAPMRWPPGIMAAGVYCALLLVAIVWAGAIWWCFERNTNSVYSALAGKAPSSEGALVRS